MPETVLITGAAGFIGYHLSRQMLRMGGVRVVGFDNLNDYYDVRLKRDRLVALNELDGFTFVQGDLSDADAVNALFEAYRPEVCVNLAAQAGVRYSLENPRVYLESNVIGFFNLLETVRRYPVKHLLFASSSSVYGNQEETPFRVSDPANRPVSLYAATKKCDELLAYSYAHLYGIPTTGLRFFTVYGPFGRPDMAYFKFADRICAGKPIDVYNHGDLLRDYTYIDDIVSTLAVMLDRPPKAEADGTRYAVYNLGDSAPVPLLHFIETLEKALGKKATLNMLPMQPGDVYKTCADIGRTQADFGFLPTTSVEEGLPLFAAWYRSYYKIS